MYELQTVELKVQVTERNVALLFYSYPVATINWLVAMQLPGGFL